MSNDTITRIQTLTTEFDEFGSTLDTIRLAQRRKEAITNCDNKNVIAAAVSSFCVEDIDSEWYRFFQKLPAKFIEESITKLRTVARKYWASPVYALLANENVTQEQTDKLEKIIIEYRGEDSFVGIFRYLDTISFSICEKIAKIIAKDKKYIDAMLDMDFKIAQNYKILIHAMSNIEEENYTDDMLDYGVEYVYSYFGSLEKETKDKKYFYFVLCSYLFAREKNDYYIQEFNFNDYFGSSKIK